jgi:hypothetical protein
LPITATLVLALRPSLLVSLTVPFLALATIVTSAVMTAVRPRSVVATPGPPDVLVLDLLGFRRLGLSGRLLRSS